MIWRTDKPKGSPIVVYRNGNPRPEVLFLATKPYPHYYDDGGEEIPDGMIQKWASLEESSLPSNLEEAAEEFADREYMVGYVDRSALYKGFWHGAEWDREQMMEKAVEAIISQCPGSNEIIFHNPSNVHSWEFPWNFSAKGLNKGDKVRIIIVKEDRK